MDKFEEVDLSMNNTNISISIIPKIDKYTTDSSDEPKTKKINRNFLFKIFLKKIILLFI